MTPTQSNYSAEDGVFYNIKEDAGPNKMSFWDTVKIVKKVFFDKASRAPKRKLPEVKPDIVSFLIPGDTVKFIWFGHSTLLLNLDGQTILIDPVFSNTASPFDFMVKRFQAPVLKLEELPHIDTIVISHDHYDHLDKQTIKYFIDKTTDFITPVGVGSHLRDWGVPSSRISELNWGDTVSRNGINFIAAPAQHFSGRGLFDRNETLWASWIVQGKHDKIFYSGDSGYSDHFKEIGHRYGPFDFAFMENGQYNERWPDVHMQPEETLQAMLDLNAHTLIPVHWGMFDLSLHHWTEPIVRTYKIAKAWDLPIITPRFGEVVDTGSSQTYSPWWEPFVQSNEQSIPLIQTNQINQPELKLVQELVTK